MVNMHDFLASHNTDDITNFARKKALNIASKLGGKVVKSLRKSLGELLP